MSADTEGYTCVLCEAAWGRPAGWAIVNRFGEGADPAPFALYADARARADELNAAVFAARFA